MFVKQITLAELDAKRFVIIEALSEDSYKMGHIPNAINIPLEMIKDEAKRELKDKTALIAVYSAGMHCGTAEKAAQELEKQGYMNVHVLTGGKQEWKNAGRKFKT